MSQPPDAFGQAPSPPTAPRPLWLARWLWIAGALVDMLRSLVQLSDRARLVDMLHNENPGMSQDELDSTANGSVLFTLITSLVLLGLYVLLCKRLLEGRRWARALLGALGALNIFGSLVTLLFVTVAGSGIITKLTGMSVRPSDLVFSALILVVDAVAVGLMFQPESNRFFRDVGRRPERSQATR